MVASRDRPGCNCVVFLDQLAVICANILVLCRVFDAGSPTVQQPKAAAQLPGGVLEPLAQLFRQAL